MPAFFRGFNKKMAKIGKIRYISDPLRKTESTTSRPGKYTGERVIDPDKLKSYVWSRDEWMEDILESEIMTKEATEAKIASTITGSSTTGTILGTKIIGTTTSGVGTSIGDYYTPGASSISTGGPYKTIIRSAGLEVDDLPMEDYIKKVIGETMEDAKKVSKLRIGDKTYEIGTGASADQLIKEGIEVLTAMVEEEDVPKEKLAKCNSIGGLVKIVLACGMRSAARDIVKEIDEELNGFVDANGKTAGYSQAEIDTLCNKIIKDYHL